ncbi:MAG: hypothetical protein LBI82_11080 [Dysgonamonadaceae bacterium]|jgi:SMC interacting uncharacterized protein involved in chromosome segregation|nr:hypothetical protein [Dysgonamonadaceae bacterium]
MKKFLLGMTIITLLLSSCGKNSAEYKELQAQNDSLKLAHLRTTGELNDILSILNEVEDGFQSIKTAENYLTVASVRGGEMTPSTRERISEDMQLITKTLQDSKDKISDLEKKLKNSGIQSSELKKTIERLRAEITDRTIALAALQEELAKKDEQIAALSENVSSLSASVSNWKTHSQEQAETIKSQESIIKTVFYCFGTDKELKDQGILVKGQLGTDFSKDYFIKEPNPEKLTIIPLYAKKAELISKHPSGTYQLEKGADGKVSLVIKDTNKFWSLTKYLVIKVNP